MRQLNVPLVKERPLHCGPTALRMILAYFGDDLREEEIEKCIGRPKKSYGVRTVALNDFAKKRGYRTACFTYSKRLRKAGTKFKAPSIKDIEDFLRNGIPVLVCVRASLLYRGQPHEAKMGHFIVITGIQKSLLFYNDPRDGKRHSMPLEKFLFAWHNHVLGSSAYLLALWPR